MCMRRTPCPLSAAHISHSSSFSKTQAAVNSSFQKTPAPVPLILPLALFLSIVGLPSLGSLLPPGLPKLRSPDRVTLLSLHPMAADGISLTHSLIPNDGGSSSSTEPNSALGYLRHSIKIFSSRAMRWTCFPHLENTRGLLLRKSALSVFCSRGTIRSFLLLSALRWEQGEGIWVGAVCLAAHTSCRFLWDVKCRQAFLHKVFSPTRSHREVGQLMLLKNLLITIL